MTTVRAKPIPLVALLAAMMFTTPSSSGSSNVQNDAPLRGVVFTVENTHDSGAGSLRQAILDANAAPGADTIVFDIPFEEPHVIELTSPLPSVTDPVTLDGDTQAGTKPLLRRSVSPDLRVADDIPSLQIVIDGAGAGHADGLTLVAGSSIVRGLVLRHFDGSGIAITGAGNNLVDDNVISDNGATGISILSGSGNRITGNSLFSNRGGGIDLSADGKDGIDLGDKDTGPNDLQNAPGLLSVRRFHCDGTDADLEELCSANDRGWTTAISGTIESLSNEPFSLEFFSTPPAESGVPEGKTFLGEARVSTGPEGSASFTINLPALGAIPYGTLITATATDSKGNTSEYSNAVAAPASVISWAAAVSGNWNDPTKWTGGVVPGASDDAQITVGGTYTVNLNAPATVNSLTVGGASGTQTLTMPGNTLTLNAASAFDPNGVLQMSGGILDGTGTLTVSSQLVWTGGTMTGAGITNANGGMSINAFIVELRSSRVLNTGGTTTWTAGQIRVHEGASITNNGTWDCPAEDQMWNVNGGSASFTNSAGATFKKSAGAGTTTVSIPFNNAGTVDVQSGTISLGGGGTSPGAFTGSGSGTVQFGGGAHTLGAASSVSVPKVVVSGGTVNVDGSYNVTSGTTVSGGTANFDPAGTVSGVGSALIISGGVANFSSGEAINATTLSVGGTLQGTDTVTVSGLTTWIGGTMTGAGITNANGGMSINGFISELRSSRVLNTGGTTTWTAGQIRVHEGASITNNGTWDCPAEDQMWNVNGGSASFTNSAGATFKKSAGAGTTTVSIPFNNAGTVDVQSGTISLGGGGTSPGAFTGSGSGTVQFGGGTHTLGAASSVSVPKVAVSGGTVNVDGSYNVTSGTTVSGGTANFDPVGTVLGAGSALIISGGVANFSSGEAINATTLSVGGTLQGTDTVTVSGLTTWTGGEMTGAGITNANGGMSIYAFIVELRSSRVLNTGGTTTWTAGQIRVHEGASITNNGTWDCPAEDQMWNVNGGSASFTNSAGATFKKSVGALTTVSIPFNNTGTVSVESGTIKLGGGGTSSGAFIGSAGTTLQFGGGTHTLGAASSVSVPTVVFSGGTVNIDGNYTVTSGTTVSGGTANFDPAGTVLGVGSALIISGGVANFSSGEAINATTLSVGGTLQGTDTVTVSGLTTWTGGEMTGAGITNANGGMSIYAFIVELRSSRVLNTGGTTTWTAGQIRVHEGASITNNGTWDCPAEDQMWNVNGGSASFTNSAGATFKKSVGALTTVSIPFNNTGTVSVESGTIKLGGGGTSSGAFIGSAGTTLQFGGGTHTLGAASSVSVPTVVFSGGTVNIDGNYTVTSGTTVSGGTANFDPAGTVSSVGSALSISGGVANFNSGEAINATTLSVGGILQGTDTVTVSGMTTWTGGEMTGAGITNANGGMSIYAFIVELRSSRVLNTGGTTTWTAGQIRVHEGASITNNGTWDCPAEDQMWNVNGGSASFTNSAGATFKKSAGAGTTTVSIPFTNAGNVQALSGTLTFSNGYQQTAGVTTLNGGTIMSPSPLDIQGGVLQGVGTLPEGVSSAGQTGPGLSPGILGISGNYTQASAGSFAVEIGGLTAGTGHDRLDVAGAATLAGALQATLVNGFGPNPGDEFTILTCGSRSGTFTTASLPSYPGIQWRVDYFDTAVKIVALLVPAGRVPGDLAAETQLIAAKSGSNITLTWTGTCVPGDIDFAVYEGVLGNFTSHVPALCSTAGATTATFAPADGDRYYLVAAHNGHEEGSYGYDSTGAERALSVAECHPQHIASCP